MKNKIVYTVPSKYVIVRNFSSFNSFSKKKPTNKMLIFFIDLKITHLKDKHFAKKNIHQNGRRNIEMLKFGNFIPFGPFLLS